MGASEPCPRLQLRAVTGATPGTFPRACWLQPRALSPGRSEPPRTAWLQPSPFSSPAPPLARAALSREAGAMGRERAGWGWRGGVPGPSRLHGGGPLHAPAPRNAAGCWPVSVPGQGGPGSQGGEGPAPPTRLGWGRLQTRSAHPSRFPGTQRAAGGAHPPPGQRGRQEPGRSQAPARQTLWGHGGLDLSL